MFNEVYKILDVALWCTVSNLGESTLAFQLVQDMLDLTSVDGAEYIFDYIEARVDLLTVDMDSSKGKGLILLRLSNELLRRLSKDKHTGFKLFNVSFLR